MIRTKHAVLNLAMLAAGVLVSAIALGAAVDVKLSGANEVPPVAGAASGMGKFMVADDGAISGSVTVTGVTAMAAHIHMGAAGANGPVVVPLQKEGENTFKVPDGTKLNADQLKAFKEGALYVNVHSATNKGGEIRGQLK